MSRVKGVEAKAILRDEIAKFATRIDFMMDIKQGPRLEANDLAWWKKNFDDKESATTDRNIAFLRAYSHIGGERLYAQGLPLADKGSVHIDRSVMRRLERDGFVEFFAAKASYFVLTSTGRDLISE